MTPSNHLLRFGRNACLMTALTVTAVPPSLFAEAAPNDSSRLQLLIGKARSLEARGRDDLAAQVWQQVLLASPGQPDAIAHLARWTKQSGRSEAPPLHAAPKSNPRLEEAGQLAAAQRYSEAMAIYREVFGLTPPPGSWSVAYYETMAATPGGLEPALASLKHLADSSPSVPEYSLSLGRLLTYSPATRLAGVNRLAAIDSSTTAGLKARSAWRQALVWEKANPSFAASTAAYLSHYPDTELESQTAAMRTHADAKPQPLTPGDKDVQLGFTALKSGSASAAKDHFQEALLKNSANLHAHEGLGFVAMKEKDFSTAITEFEAAKGSTNGTPELRAASSEARFWITMDAAGKALEAQDWKLATDSYSAALALRPKSPEALNGLAGAYLASQQPAKAEPVLRTLVALQPGNESGWENFVRASLDAKGATAALQVINSVPTLASARLSARLSWKCVRARVYQDAGDLNQAQSLYRELISAGNSSLTPDALVDLASLSLHFEQPIQAATYASRAVELSPANGAAWELLLSSLTISHRETEANRLMSRIPAGVLPQISAHPGFQQTLASLREASGDLTGARTLLQELAASDHRLSRQAQMGLTLHIADLDAKLGNGEQALARLNELAIAEPDNAAVLRARLSVLSTLKRPADVVTAYAEAPQAIALKLRENGDIISLVATAYAAEGRREFAIRLLEGYTLQSTGLEAGSKAPQKLQLGWLLLDSPNSGAMLYRLLDELNGERSLTADARTQLDTLWTTWILRSAEASRVAGDPARALALLDQGAKQFADNPKLQAAYAGQLLAAGDTRRALNVYANWGLAGAQPDDIAGAAGAALAQHDTRTAETWIADGLTRYPAHPKLLTMAGDLSRTKGDMRRAHDYWKQALALQQAQSQTQNNRVASIDASQTPPLDRSSARLRTLLVGASNSENAPALQSAAFVGDATPVHLSGYGSPAASFDAQPARLGSHERNRLPVGIAPMPEAAIAPADSLVENLQDKLASIESRNSPYLSSEMSIWGRGGQAGLGKLLIQQETIKASTTIADFVRASFVLKPTYLSAGTADGSGTNLFGTQPKPASFGVQSQSGVAGEAELAGRSFGLMIGSTPRGFLTNSWTGGFRLQPGNGPITLLVSRDNVKETLLSYSGARDPISGQVWGGVMSDAASLRGQWGDSQSGLYVSGGYQSLTGRNVARNKAYDGNAGAWWKVLTRPEGDLTVGLNFSAMHYDRNLRYFTLGQGGYFSPQQYFLTNVPVRWTGHRNRLQYTIGLSAGLQHFAEDASAFYPTNTVLQSQTNSQYAAMANTGLNFNFDSRVGYQLAPHWMLGAFASASNARNYTAGSGGVFVRYTFEERPMTFAAEGAPSLPDWRGQDPFHF